MKFYWQRIKNIYHLYRSFIANVYYGFPARKLTVIGVTGTSGKTTTTLMIYEILKAAGYKVSVLSTIKGVIAGKEYDTGFHVTTPDPQTLPKYLKQAVENGDTHFVLEVSSHALDQNRAAFVPFAIGVLTTLAHEHLDYHLTMENYAKAKFKLLHAAKIAVVPELKIDKSLQKAVEFEKLREKMITFGISGGNETQDKWKLDLSMPGEFNLLNGLAAVVASEKAGVDKKTIKSALHNFTGIPGRLELIPNDRGINIIIDFAHKPDALEAVLQVAQTIVKKGSRIIVMFGCASERDTLKRSIMGEISGKLADITVLTDEDPRHEDPMKIIDEIAAGCTSAGAEEFQISNDEYQISNKQHIYFKIPDRAKAIDFIVNKLAQKGDIILLCGKGHEQSMNYNGLEKPWSEHEAVREALKK